jgi:hypothetical protein
MTQNTLLERLDAELRQLLDTLRTRLAPLDDAALQYRSAPEAWNALECFAHLNAYADRYIPRMELAIHKAKARNWKPEERLRYTAAGSRFIRRADPANTKPRKAAKTYNFHRQPLGREPLKRLIINVERLLRIVQMAREVDLNRAKVGRGKSGFFTLTLGNALEWTTLHTQRHVGQAGRHLG